MKAYKRLIEDYFARCESEARPPTITGLALALGLNSRAELERLRESAGTGELVENAVLRIENFNEEKLFEKDYARSAIFNLTNAYADNAVASDEKCAVKIPAELMAASFLNLYRDIRGGGHGEYTLKGGRGSAKSSFAALVTVERLMNDKNSHAVALRQVGATLKDSVYARLCWAIDALGLGNEFEYRQSPLELVRKSTRQKIYFRGADDPSKLKSLSPPFGYVGTVWLEELDQFTGERSLRSIVQSLIRGGDGIVLETFNPPPSKNNWVNLYAAMPKKNRLVHTSVYTDVPREWLGERFVEEAEYLRKTNAVAYAHEYLGECTESGGTVFENLTIREITDDEIARFDRIYNGIDWGWYPDPFRFCRVSYSAADRRLYIFDEFGGNKLPNAVIAEKLAEHVDRSERITADSGGEGPKSIADLRTAGFHIRGAVKGPGSVEYSMKWLCGLKEIVVDAERCPFAAREFSRYEFERDRDGEPVGGYPDRDNHSIDAVRYALEEVWRRRGT